MTKEESAVIEAAHVVAAMKYPSVPKLLTGHGYAVEAERVQALIDAVAALQASKPR